MFWNDLVQWKCNNFFKTKSSLKCCHFFGLLHLFKKSLWASKSSPYGEELSNLVTLLRRHKAKYIGVNNQKRRRKKFFLFMIMADIFTTGLVFFEDKLCYFRFTFLIFCNLSYWPDLSYFRRQVKLKKTGKISKVANLLMLDLNFRISHQLVMLATISCSFVLFTFTEV